MNALSIAKLIYS